LSAIREPGRLADAAVPYLRLPLKAAQELLEMTDIVARLERIQAMKVLNEPGAT
jgi:hypothetical protein